MQNSYSTRVSASALPLRFCFHIRTDDWIGCMQYAWWCLLGVCNLFFHTWTASATTTTKFKICVFVTENAVASVEFFSAHCLAALFFTVLCFYCFCSVSLKIVIVQCALVVGGWIHIAKTTVTVATHHSHQPHIKNSCRIHMCNQRLLWTPRTN